TAKGDMHVAQLIDLLEKSQAWQDTAIIITYDENGGFWDHVSPPKMDQWGPGARVPTLIISPYAKKGFVDHTQMDTTSILAFMETRYALKPLGDRDRMTNNMLSAFDFSQVAAAPATPAAPITLPNTGGDTLPVALVLAVVALLVIGGAFVRRIS